MQPHKHESDWSWKDGSPHWILRWEFQCCRRSWAPRAEKERKRRVKCAWCREIKSEVMAETTAVYRMIELFPDKSSESSQSLQNFTQNYFDHEHRKCLRPNLKGYFAQIWQTSLFFHCHANNLATVVCFFKVRWNSSRVKVAVPKKTLLQVKVLHFKIKVEIY